MQLEIPQDIIDITKECQWEIPQYAEFDISITVSREGEIMVRDMLGVWSGDKCSVDLTPEEAWSIIRKWWENEQDNIAAVEYKNKLEEQITKLQYEVEKLNKTAKKKKWFW